MRWADDKRNIEMNREQYAIRRGAHARITLKKENHMTVEEIERLASIGIRPEVNDGRIRAWSIEATGE